MWLLLLILLGFSSCFIITLIFGLLGAGRRADEGEERILEIMSPAPLDKGILRVRKRDTRPHHPKSLQSNS